MGRKKRFNYFAWPVGTQEASYSPYGPNQVKARTTLIDTTMHPVQYLDGLPSVLTDTKRRYHVTCCDIEPAVLGKSPVLGPCSRCSSGLISFSSERGSLDSHQRSPYI